MLQNYLKKKNSLIFNQLNILLMKMGNGQKKNKNLKKIFGVPLQEAAEKSDQLLLVPSVLRHSFAYLNQKGK
jgi:site-specific recombinase XerD